MAACICILTHRPGWCKLLHIWNFKKALLLQKNRQIISMVPENMHVEFKVQVIIICKLKLKMTLGNYFGVYDVHCTIETEKVVFFLRTFSISLPQQNGLNISPVWIVWQCFMTQVLFCIAGCDFCSTDLQCVAALHPESTSVRFVWLFVLSKICLSIQI